MFIFDSGWSVRIAEFALTWWLQSGLLVAIGLLAAIWFRRRDAATESTVNKLTLIGAVACPLLAVLLSLSGVSMLTIDLKSKLASADPIVENQMLETDTTSIVLEPAIDAQVANPFGGNDAEAYAASDLPFVQNDANSVAAVAESPATVETFAALAVEEGVATDSTGKSLWGRVYFLLLDSAGEYPGSRLAQRLKTISQLIKSGAGSRIYYTSKSGYDTHANQDRTHGNLLGVLSSSLKAFMNDMRDSGLEDRVLVMAFSEFGRRVNENASSGTDHGTAGPVVLAGTKLRQRFFGEIPSLTDLVDGDVKHSVDFRDVYASILTDWLQLQPARSLAAFGDTKLFES